MPLEARMLGQFLLDGCSRKMGVSPDAGLWAVITQIVLPLLVFCCWPYFVMPILCLERV